MRRAESVGRRRVRVGKGMVVVEGCRLQFLRQDECLEYGESEWTWLRDEGGDNRCK